MFAAAVESTTLANIAYEADRQVLWLEFRSHAVYSYFGVPASVYYALLEADSKGAYFNRSIRNRFVYEQVAANSAASVFTSYEPAENAIINPLPLGPRPR